MNDGPLPPGHCRACTCARPTTSRDKSQSGLPLCTCRHLVAAHEGHGIVWGVGSEPGR